MRCVHDSVFAVVASGMGEDFGESVASGFGRLFWFWTFGQRFYCSIDKAGRRWFPCDISVKCGWPGGMVGQWHTFAYGGFPGVIWPVAVGLPRVSIPMFVGSLVTEVSVAG